MNKEIHLIGNAHLDPIWLWRWQEGCGEVLQTFRSALDRLNEYDDFVFTCSSAAHYRWVEEIDPDMFEEIRQMVKAGRIVPVNGWWVQADCNMPSAESYARQALYSQLYYYEKFGRICRTGYNVDSFGHSRMIPQLLKKGGMDFYVMMRPEKHENADIPAPLFNWHSPDGSNVLTYHIPNGYARDGVRSIDEAVEFLGNLADEKNCDVMMFYGVGNHGGGPTKGDIEHLKALKENGANIKFSSPDEYFREICTSGIDAPVWDDDLQHHASGCYSATSLIKKLNRKAEAWLQNAEKWNTVACKTAGQEAKTKEFAEAWRKVCFNQFHDIMCGCSIMEAYDDVRDSEGYAMTVAASAENNALLRLTLNMNTWLDGVSETKTLNERHHCRNLDYPRPVVVFNPNSFEVTVPVRTYHPSSKVENSANEPVLFQNVRSSRSNDSHLDTVFFAKVPALGYALYWLYWGKEERGFYEPKIESDVRANNGDEITIENEYIAVKFSKTNGAVSSLITKSDGREYAGSDNFCLPTVFDNKKPDTWAHNIFRFDEIIDTMKLQSIELVENGKLRSVVRTKHTYGKSVLTQDYILPSGMKTLRVKAKAIWQEPLTILKIPFPVRGENGISTYEVPGGFIKRPCNGEEEPALKWGDISVSSDGARYGITVFSDSKYSYSCPENELRLTVIRNSIFADHYSDRPAAEFNYCDEGVQRFEYAVMPHSGDVDIAEATKTGEVFLNRPVAVPAGYHKGTLPPVKSYLTIDAENVIADAVKFCEDGSGDAIIRCRETAGRAVTAMIKCDMLDAAFYSDFYPTEIKTFRIDKDGYVTETNFLEGIV